MMLAEGFTPEGWVLIISALFAGFSSLIVALKGLKQGQDTNTTLTNGHDQMVSAVMDLTRQLNEAGVEIKPLTVAPLGSGVSGAKKKAPPKPK